MSPVKRSTRAAKRPTKRATPRPRRAAKPIQPPPPWSANIRELGLVSVNVTDWDRAKKFYGETLGFPIAYAGEDFGWIEYGHPDQAHLAINLWRGPEPMPPTGGGGTPVFTCYDVRATIEQFRANGVRCEDPQEVPGVVLYANCYDPEGNRLQLAQSIMPA